MDKNKSSIPFLLSSIRCDEIIKVLENIKKEKS